MINKEIAEWLQRYTGKYGLPKAAKCAKCLCDPKLEVKSEGSSGTGRLVCSNSDCKNACFSTSSEDCEKLLKTTVEEWNSLQRKIIRNEAKKATKKK